MHLVLIGAGPHGLAVLAALADRASWPEHVTVIDPHAGWCTAWDAKLGRLALDRLRSPQVHHPGPRPMQLRDLVEALPSDEQLALRRPEAERAPTPAGMRRFVDGLVDGLGPLDRIVGQARQLEPSPGGGPVRIDIDTDPTSDDAHASGRTTPRTLSADAVVLAHNPSMPRIPSWARPLVAAGRAEHASDVNVRAAQVAGREVVIVGGGLTAACLALEVGRRGGSATIVTRRPLRARPYDVDASWIGPRRLAGYRAASPSERRALIDEARDGGTIPPRTLDELRRAVAAGDGQGPVRLLEAVDVEPAVRALLDSAGPAPMLWLATGFEQDVRRDRLVGPLVEALGVPVHGGLPEVGDDLRLDGTPVFVTGPYAALAVGPACRNLAGARPAAARIAIALIDEHSRRSAAAARAGRGNPQHPPKRAPSRRRAAGVRTSHRRAG